MLIAQKISDLEQHVSALRKALPSDEKERFKVGFVPTMGALHEGHISLVERSVGDSDITIVSIFVNPTQFNNADDLKNYPRNIEKDISLLEMNKADIVFIPETVELYPNGTEEKIHFDFGKIEEVMEGKFRPGHFNGVAQIVSKLFEIVKPNRAYFGEKDFQQLAIIRDMVKQKKYKVEIIACPTVREKNGLAMSSRNARLTSAEREEARQISQALFFIRDNWRQMTIEEAKEKAKKIIEESGRMKIEYLVLADEMNLQPVTGWSTESNRIRCFVAVHLGNVRLIDNIPLNTTFAA